MTFDVFVKAFFPIALAAYFCGCFNGAIMISKRKLHDDVRRRGSGNAGLTNFYRNYGARYAGFVIVLDMLKAAVAVGFAVAWLRHLQLGEWTSVGKYTAGLFCVIGHMYPCMFSFKGGKGILCSGALLLCLDWRIALVGWGLFMVLWLSTRYVSLGSISAALSFPVTTYLFMGHDVRLTVLAALIALLVIVAHRENIKRLLHGTESKFHWHVNPVNGQDK